MKDFLVYLAGPITGLTYKGTVGWREDVRRKFGAHIHTISPMRGKQRHELLGDQPILTAYEENPLTSEKGISIRDYNDVKRADCLLVNFLGATKVSIGTVMEIAWARAFQIPVVIVMEKDNLHNHAMIRYSSFIVDNMEDAVELVKVILGPDNEL